MPARLAFKGLEEIERRIAFMHLSGASNNTIAYMCETSVNEVSVVLHRPNVARFVAQQQALYVEDLRPVMRDMNKVIAEHTEEAFEVETGVMRRMYNIDEEHRDYVRAQLGAASTAQDILDRAGNRAPTKVVQTNRYEIDDKTLNQLDRIMGEVENRHAIDVTPSNGNGKHDD